MTGTTPPSNALGAGTLGRVALRPVDRMGFLGATLAVAAALGPPVLAQTSATVVAERLPLSAAAYPEPVRAALLAGSVEPSLFADLPTVSVQGGGKPNGNLRQLSLTVPATGLPETYLVFEPLTPAPSTPLLVHFHAANVSAYDLVFFTDFLTEADVRNWYVLAPYQLVAQAPVTNSYSALPSQLHVEAVMDWVLATYPAIDRDRIYGYGFSMGGGNALNYAARHLDRETGTFAALVNHTGTVCLPDEYRNAVTPAAVQPVMEVLFGGTPAARPFEYLRSSVLDLDAASALSLGGDHVAVNLAHVPIQSWFAVGDPQAHLVRQARRLGELLDLVPGSAHTIVEVPGNLHRWDTLDEYLVCEWFAQRTLSVPSGGELRVDRSGRYHGLELTVGATDRFARLFFDMRADRLSLTRTENVVEVEMSAPAIGLDPASLPFEVLVETADGTPDRIVIRDFTRAPTTVLRNGVTVLQGFTYDGGQQILTLEGPDGGTHLWSVQ